MHITFLFYALLIALATPPQLHWVVKISFWIFSLYLFWTLTTRETLEKEKPIKNGWLLLPLSILIITRLIPFIRWQNVIPLGADAGTYLRNFNTCCGSMEILLAHLLQLFGWQVNYVTFLFYIILNIFVGLSIYLVTKEYFNKSAAFFSFLLFSLSTSQFLAYFAFYWKMMLAMGLTLISFYLLKRKSWLVIPVAGFMGSVHAVSFIPFGLAMVLYFIFGKDKKFTFLSGVGILLIFFSTSWKSFIGWLPYLTEKFGKIEGYSQGLTEILQGHFIDFNLYSSLILIYIPFAILGLIQLIKKKESNYLLFYFIANFSIIYFNLIFHNRFIILFDLIAIILAGVMLSKFFFNYRPAAILFFTATAFMVFYISWFTEPFLTDPSEMAEIKFLARTEKNSYVVITDNLYRPYLYGYSQRPIIEYINNRDLEKYTMPLYIYIGSKTKNPPDLSNSPNFKQISPHIWRFNYGSN